MSSRDLERLQKKIDKLRYVERQATFQISQLVRKEQIELQKIRDEYDKKRKLLERELQHTVLTLKHMERDVQRLQVRDSQNLSD